jgi:hypothetical protein
MFQFSLEGSEHGRAICQFEAVGFRRRALLEKEFASFLEVGNRFFDCLTLGGRAGLWVVRDVAAFWGRNQECVKLHGLEFSAKVIQRASAASVR